MQQEYHLSNINMLASIPENNLNSDSAQEKCYQFIKNLEDMVQYTEDIDFEFKYFTEMLKTNPVFFGEDITLKAEMRAERGLGWFQNNAFANSS